MFDTICTLPLPNDLFAQSVHPTNPIIAVGLASGHVQTHRLPALDDVTRADTLKGRGTIETLWRTRRHKGSCRALAFSTDGEHLFSAGTDGIVKAAATETGQVSAKIAVPLHNGKADAPTLLHIPSPQTLLLATDSSALHFYDLRAPNSISPRPQQTHHPHDDYISSLTPLPSTEASTSGYSKQFVTTGGSTLAVTDLRRGVLVKSEDQEEELLSSVYIGGRGAKRAEKVVVGCGNGVLTLWDRGVWDDQGERVIVDAGRGGGESLDVLTAVPEGVGAKLGANLIAVGLGDGRISFVRIGGKGNEVVGDCRHDDVEAVLGLGFEVGGRMVSGGGNVIKVWQESVEDEESEESDGGVGSLKRKAGKDEGESEDEGEDSVEEERERKTRKKKKKKKKGKGAKVKDGGGGKDVLGFKGMD